MLLKCILPLVVITCAYIKIGVYLVQNKLPQTCLGETGAKNYSAVARKENVQVVKLLVTTVLLFGLCTSPHQIAWMLFQFGKEKEQEIAKVIFKFSAILQNIHACFNPFIYGIMSKQFRRPGRRRSLPVHWTVQYFVNVLGNNVQGTKTSKQHWQVEKKRKLFNVILFWKMLFDRTKINLFK